MRYGRPYDQEDEAARLLRRASGTVAVWSDGSVCWFRGPITQPGDEPICIPCPLGDGAARRAYTGAIREWWRREG